MISLWGFMGSGKSTIGEHLSERYGWVHIDADGQIQDQLNMSIPHVFEQHGEAYFREQETQYLRQLLSVESGQEDRQKEGYKVLTTGGGMPMLEENRRLLTQLGPTFYLHVSFDEIVKRVGDDSNRPLWNANEQQKMREKYEQRLSIYGQADYVIHTDGMSVEQVGKAILIKL